MADEDDTTSDAPKTPGGSGTREDPGPSVKDHEVYAALRDDGASKEKAARIANAAANSSRKKVGRKGGEAGSSELDVEGRSGMNKDDLIKALRDR